MRYRTPLLRLIGSIQNRKRRPTPKHVARMVVVRPDHLGDVLLTTPALGLLRAAFPSADITLLVGPWSRDVAARQPAVDHVGEIRFPGFERGIPASILQRYTGLAVLARRLSTERYDAAIIMRPDFWWGAWLAAAAGIPVRLGYAHPEVQPFLTHAIPVAARRHSAVDALELARTAARRWGTPQLTTAWQPGVPPLSFPLRSADRHDAVQRLHKAGITPTESFVLVHIGAGAAVKRWTRSNWISLIVRIKDHLGVPVLVCGGPTEQAEVAVIAAAAGGVTLSSGASFATLGAVMQRAMAVVGADSGAMHLAVAVGAPTTTLFGPADPVVYGPWGAPRRHAVVTSAMICSPCTILGWPAGEVAYHPCVRRITVDEVYRALERVVAIGRVEGVPR